MYVWRAPVDRRTEGWTDRQPDGRTEGLKGGRTCNDIVLGRRDRKEFCKYFREFEKILHEHDIVCSGLRALVHGDGPTGGRMDAYVDERTDGRTDGHVTTLC